MVLIKDSNKLRIQIEKLNHEQKLLASADCAKMSLVD